MPVRGTAFYFLSVSLVGIARRLLRASFALKNVPAVLSFSTLASYVSSPFPLSF